MSEEESRGGRKAPLRRETVLGLKATPEWKVWLEEFAEFYRLSMADTIDQSLAEQAAGTQGFQPPRSSEAHPMSKAGTRTRNRHRSPLGLDETIPPGGGPGRLSPACTTSRATPRPRSAARSARRSGSPGG